MVKRSPKRAAASIGAILAKGNSDVDQHPFPHREKLKEYGLDEEFVEYEFRSLRILPSDAYLDIGGGAIHLSYLLDSKLKGRKKLKAARYWRCDEVTGAVAPESKPIPKEELRDAINDLEPRIEASV